jgi:MFS family permease
MSEAIEQPGGAALPRPMGVGDILSTALALYRRHWQTLLAIAAVVVVPLTLLQYLLGHWVRTQGEATSNGVVSTSSWAVGVAGLVAGLAGLLMYPVLTGAITRAVAAEVAGEDPSVEQSYRFGFHRLGPVLLVSVLVGLAILGGFILFALLIGVGMLLGFRVGTGTAGVAGAFAVLIGIYVGVRLALSTQALVVEGRRGTEAMRRSWSLVGGHWWHAFGALLVAALLTGVVNAVITAPFSGMGWVVQGLAAAVATVVTLPYGVLVGVLLYLELRARKETLSMEALRADLRASAA